MEEPEERPSEKPKAQERRARGAKIYKTPKRLGTGMTLLLLLLIIVVAFVMFRYIF